MQKITFQQLFIKKYKIYSIKDTYCTFEKAVCMRRYLNFKFVQYNKHLHVVLC